MVESDPRRRLRVGVFMAVTIVLFGVAILLLGKKQRLFVRQVPFVARFEHVGGLVPVAPLWLNGVVVGSVSGDVEVAAVSGLVLWIDAQSVSGTMSSELDVGDEPAEPGQEPVELRIRTVSGDVRVARSAAAAR